MLVRILSHIPLGVHYFLADYLLYPLTYYVIRYRRKVVDTNLRRSFPDKTAEELAAIRRHFYHHFSAVIVEIIYGMSISDEEMLQRMRCHNTEEVQQLTKQYGGSFLMLGHLGNWEWAAAIHLYLLPKQMHLCSVYRQLTNQTMDNLMKSIRLKRTDLLSEKNVLLRTIIRHRHEKQIVAYGMVADQKPSPRNAHFWTTFLSQDTSFLEGSEVLARRFEYPVFYAHIFERQRGYYDCTFELIAQPPFPPSEYAITERYARLLEEDILRQPSMWLWTHNRWKFSRTMSDKQP